MFLKLFERSGGMRPRLNKRRLPSGTMQVASGVDPLTDHLVPVRAPSTGKTLTGLPSPAVYVALVNYFAAEAAHAVLGVIGSYAQILAPLPKGYVGQGQGWPLKPGVVAIQSDTRELSFVYFLAAGGGELLKLPLRWVGLAPSLSAADYELYLFYNSVGTPSSKHADLIACLRPPRADFTFAVDPTTNTDVVSVLFAYTYVRGIKSDGSFASAHEYVFTSTSGLLELNAASDITLFDESAPSDFYGPFDVSFSDNTSHNLTITIPATLGYDPDFPEGKEFGEFGGVFYGHVCLYIAVNGVFYRFNYFRKTMGSPATVVLPIWQIRLGAPLTTQYQYPPMGVQWSGSTEPEEYYGGPVMASNGSLVIWSGRKLQASTPKYPEGYPPENVFFARNPIVDVVPHGAGAVVLTTSSTEMVQFTSSGYPSGLPISDEGCSDPFSVAPAPGLGVIFANLNGLFAVTSSGVKSLIEDLLLPEQWGSYFAAGMECAGIFWRGLYIFASYSFNGSNHRVNHKMWAFDFANKEIYLLHSFADETSSTYRWHHGQFLVRDVPGQSTYAKKALWYRLNNTFLEIMPKTGAYATATARTGAYLLPHGDPDSRPPRYAVVDAEAYPVTLRVYSDQGLVGERVVTDNKEVILPGIEGKAFYVEYEAVANAAVYGIYCYHDRREYRP